MNIKLNLAPICLFTYNRLDETKHTVTALQSNFLASKSELFIFSDGPKSNTVNEVSAVRAYLKSIKGFKKVTISESKINMGLANSIISGVSTVLGNNKTVIVLEDDLITTPNFLDFMNQALDFYSSDKSILSTTGYTLDLPSLPKNKDFYFGYRASSWGWGTWRDRWQNIDWGVSDYNEFYSNKKLVKKFKAGGSDMPRMLRRQMEGKIDSWAIRFCYHQFKNELYTVFPNLSKIQSIGFSKKATHTSGSKRFKTKVDNSFKRKFKFEKYDKINKDLAREFSAFFSLKNRITNQLYQKLNF